MKPLHYSTLALLFFSVPAHKTFRVFEKLKLQLPGEAEGAMNHPNFDAPNNSPTSSLFGRVNATQTGQEERRIFVGLKLLWWTGI